MRLASFRFLTIR